MSEISAMSGQDTSFPKAGGINLVVDSMDNSSNLPDRSDAEEATATLRKQRMRFTFPSGSTPLKGYTIKRGLGIGGFGEVYFAVSDSGKEVALKRIARNLDVELRGVTQCLNLKHANLIGLWDIQVDDHHENWVVMEYVSGPSLRDVLQANPNGLAMDDVIWWFQGITAGVHYLHQNGIVHRDLKPGNIFHDTEAQLVKIGDYGLSKFISCSQRSGHTESVGTVHYMAPEIGRGIYGREIDVYSLGIVLFELLTGRVPFEGECSQEIIMKHLTAEPDVSALPSPFNKVVRHALLKDPEQRYSTVLEMISDLPKEFWPVPLRRSILQLQDTGKHEFPEVATDQPPSPDGGLDTRDNRQVGESQSTSPASREQGTEISYTSELASSNRQPLLDGLRGGGNGAAGASSARRPSTYGEFNRPPAPARSSRHSVQNSAGVYSRDQIPRPGESGLGAPPIQSRLQPQFPHTPTGMVFGDVQFHDVVEAEVVPTPPPAPAKPVAVPGTPAPRLLSEPDHLTARTKRNWWRDRRYLVAARRFQEQQSGVERLAHLLQGFLISAAVMALFALAISLLLKSDPGEMVSSPSGVASGIDLDNRFALGTWFFLAGTACCWLIQSVALVWTPSAESNGSRFASLLPISFGAAVIASVIATGIGVIFRPYAGGNDLLLRGYLGQLLNFNGTPQFLGFFLFFLLTFVASAWWRQTSPVRVHRFALFPILRCALAGALTSIFLGLGVLVPAFFCGVISLAVQLSSHYLGDEQRTEIRNASLHS